MCEDWRTWRVALAVWCVFLPAANSPTCPQCDSGLILPPLWTASCWARVLGGSFLLSAPRHAACHPWPSKCLSESPWLLSRAPSPRFKALATGAGTASCLWMPSGAHRASWLHICVSDHTWRLSCHPVPLPAGSSSPRRPLLSPVQPPLHLSPVSSARGPLTVPLLPAVQSLRGISYFRCCIFLGLKLPPGFLLHL